MKQSLIKHICYNIASGGKYIAAFGSGVTILERASLTIVHHFTGFRYIIGGFFINDDTVAVYTTEQKLFLLSIQDKKVIWSMPRFSQIETSGDMRCGYLPEHDTILCIAKGRKNLNEHYLIRIDCRCMNVSVNILPETYRVINKPVIHSGGEMSLLTYQAVDRGVGLLYRIIEIDSSGVCTVKREGCTSLSLCYYSGRYLFAGDYSENQPKLGYIDLQQHSHISTLEQSELTILPVPSFDVGSTRAAGCPAQQYLPEVSYVDETCNQLIVCNRNGWIGLINLQTREMTAKFEIKNAIYGTIIDGRLFVGCSPGLVVVPLIENS